MKRQNKLLKKWRKGLWKERLFPNTIQESFGGWGGAWDKPDQDNSLELYMFPKSEIAVLLFFSNAFMKIFQTCRKTERPNMDPTCKTQSDQYFAVFV